MGYKILALVKSDNAVALKKYLKANSVRSVAQLIGVGEERVKCDITSTDKDCSYHDISFWNPVHFAIYYKSTQVLKLILEEFSPNFIHAQRLPPLKSKTEYILFS